MPNINKNSGLLNQTNQKEGNAVDNEVGTHQMSLNNNTKPKKVIQMLKDKQEINSKQKIIQMQQDNIQM